MDVLRKGTGAPDPRWVQLWKEACEESRQGLSVADQDEPEIFPFLETYNPTFQLEPNSAVYIRDALTLWLQKIEKAG